MLSRFLINEPNSYEKSKKKPSRRAKKMNKRPALPYIKTQTKALKRTVAVARGQSSELTPGVQRTKVLQEVLD